MAKTIEQLKAQGAMVKNATVVGENTATRVGTLFNDIVEHVEEYEVRQTADTEANTQAIAKRGIYDVSAYNGGAVFESLSALLNNDNLSTLIPASVRCGGMSIRFIQGSVPNSDNKYVQYRLMSNSFNTTVANWQGVDDVPTAGSNNLVKSGSLIGKKEIMGSLLDADLSLNPLYADFYENTVIFGSPYHDRLTLIASKMLLKGHKYSIIIKIENAENIIDNKLDIDFFSTNDLTDFNFVDEHISGLLKNHKQELSFKGYKFDYIPSSDANYLGLYLDTATDGLQCSTFIYEEKDDSFVKYVIQELTPVQKKQARNNIGIEDNVYFGRHILGSPFYQSQELIVEYPFKKGHTYIIHISTNANITNGIYSLANKDPFTIAEENLFFIGDSPSELVYAFKPLKDAIGLGTWIENLDGKYVNVTIYDKTPEEVTYVIVDADICGDIDDLFAMRVLAQAEKQGKIVLVGINVSQPATQTAAGIDGFFCHDGISDICLGLDSTATVSSSKFLNECQKHYHTYTDNTELEESLVWYERALNFIPDNSKAILLTLGYYTSLVRLFNNTSLKSLFQRKINHVYCMGGNFVDPNYPEYNFQYNVENTRIFIGQCPVPIYFVGFETCGNVMGGKVIGERGYTFDLMQMALRAFYNNQYAITEPMERNAPDAVAAMIACVDDPEYYNLKYVKGNISVNNNGSIAFTPSATGFRKWYAVWVNETEDYPYELWKETMEMKLSHIMARDNEGVYSNVVRLARA